MNLRVLLNAHLIITHRNYKTSGNVNIPNLEPFESRKIRHVQLRTDRAISPVVPHEARPLAKLSLMESNNQLWLALAGWTSGIGIRLGNISPGFICRFRRNSQYTQRIRLWFRPWPPPFQVGQHLAKAPARLPGCQRQQFFLDTAVIWFLALVTKYGTA